MAAGGIRIEGLAKVVRDLQALGLEVSDLKEAFGSIASQGAELASGFAPRSSGRLAGNVRGNKAKNKAVISVGGASVPYAGPINYGWRTRNIAPAGFMQKADEAMQPKAAQQLEEAINHAIRRKNLT